MHTIPMNKLHRSKQTLILNALVEGVSMRATSRMAGVPKASRNRTESRTVVEGGNEGMGLIGLDGAAGSP